MIILGVYQWAKCQTRFNIFNWIMSITSIFLTFYSKINFVLMGCRLCILQSPLFQYPLLSSTLLITHLLKSAHRPIAYTPQGKRIDTRWPRVCIHSSYDGPLSQRCYCRLCTHARAHSYVIRKFKISHALVVTDKGVKKTTSGCSQALPSNGTKDLRRHVLLCS